MRIYYSLPVALGILVILSSGCAPHAKTGSSPTEVGQDLGVTPSPPAAAEPQPQAAPTAPVEPFPEVAQKFDRPWSHPDAAIVIDAYQGNSIDWNKLKLDPRVAAVVHRSSIGLKVDSLYRSRRQIAESHGFLWGAYHLGKSGDPVAQAKVFLDTIGDAKNVLMILDLEDTSDPNMMNVAGGKKFLSYIYEQTGRVPVVYANHSVTKALNADGSAIFKKSRLWYARFRRNIPDFPRGIWPTYFMWQFSSEINCSSNGNCLYNVPGTQFDMDVNVFYGGRKALEYQWRL